MVITTIILLKEKALYVFQVPMPLFLGDLQWISSRFAADILWGLLSKYHFKTLTHTARCYFFQRAISGFSCLSNLGASINIFHSCPLEIFYTSSNKLKLISCILTFPSVPNKLIKKKKTSSNPFKLPREFKLRATLHNSLHRKSNNNFASYLHWRLFTLWKQYRPPSLQRSQFLKQALPHLIFWKDVPKYRVGEYNWS